MLYLNVSPGIKCYTLTVTDFCTKLSPAMGSGLGMSTEARGRDGCLQKRNPDPRPEKGYALHSAEL